MAGFISVRLHGGLGNKMLQLFFAYGIARRLNRPFKIVDIKSNRHSNLEYFDTVFAFFRRFVDLESRTKVTHVVRERACDSWTYINYVTPEQHNVMFSGYFQSYKYASMSFSISELRTMVGLTPSVKSAIATRFPNSACGVFLHVRRGDYLTAPHICHMLNLDAYYHHALELLDKTFNDRVWTLYVVSDDLPHCQTSQYLTRRDSVVFVEDDLSEVDTFYLMASCNLGGIAANSTFSLLGAYLIKNPEKIVTLPSPWWNGPEYSTNDLYFPGCMKIDTDLLNKSFGGFFTCSQSVQS
jgi:hypothetical protein